MRTVSFSSPSVRATLAKSFYSTTTNIEGDPAAGVSLKHAPSDRPGPNRKGVGHQNVQVLFTTPDGKIFHTVTGYLPPRELARECQVALALFRQIERAPERAESIVTAAHRKKLRPPKGRSQFAALLDRTYQDNLFMAKHPLITRDQLEKNPRLLVGIANTAYGSGEASGSPNVNSFQIRNQAKDDSSSSKRVIIVPKK